jgi:hypothetical protein
MELVSGDFFWAWLGNTGFLLGGGVVIIGLIAAGVWLLSKVEEEFGEEMVVGCVVGTIMLAMSLLIAYVKTSDEYKKPKPPVEAVEQR